MGDPCGLLVGDGQPTNLRVLNKIAYTCPPLSFPLTHPETNISLPSLKVLTGTSSDEYEDKENWKTNNMSGFRAIWTDVCCLQNTSTERFPIV